MEILHIFVLFLAVKCSPLMAKECSDDGTCSQWSLWTDCSATCGSGHQARFRECSGNCRPANVFEEEDVFDEKPCFISPCPVTWSEWEAWGPCNVTCGGGQQSRVRKCLTSSCIGSNAELRNCGTSPCLVNGLWSLWGSWTCSVTCGEGPQSRYRSCNNPAPADGGAYCEGVNNQTETCSQNLCPVNGLWSLWGSWTCTVTCGEGTRSRFRSCNNPTPANGGGYCEGVNNQTETCSQNLCPVNGLWSLWGSWTCSVTCGEGMRSRYRSCNNPTPAHGGAYCEGVNNQTETCSQNLCPVNGLWSLWGSWTCSVTCGEGMRSRYRSCNNPTPAHGGAYCEGVNNQTETCSQNLCPVNGLWSLWGSWTCSVTCGEGMRSRYRSCNNPTPAHGGAYCEGVNNQTETCSQNLCPVNGHWGIWGHWSSCSVTCDGGILSRQRLCDNPMPVHGGSDCDGNSTTTQTCSLNKCQNLAESSMSITAVIAGTISACVLSVTVALAVIVVLRKRRQKNAEKHTDYVVSNMREVEEHVYIQTRRINDYCNTDLQSSVQVKNKEIILAKYNSSELSKMFLDKQLCEKQIQHEFQWLTKNKPHEQEADYVNVPVKNESYFTYLNTTILKKNETNCVAMVTELPNTNNIEMFWTLVNNFKVHDIILLVQKQDKITHVFPMTDEPIEMQSVEVKMISSGRQENHIFSYSFELTDQERKTVIEIRLHKTTNWKIGETFPDISTLCKLITNLNGNSTCVLMTGNKGNGYRICGVLGVCFEVVNTIKDDKKFSILQIAQDMMKTRPDLFQSFEEYELCYNILRHYLENEHCYAVIT